MKALNRGKVRLKWMRTRSTAVFGEGDPQKHKRHDGSIRSKLLWQSFWTVFPLCFLRFQARLSTGNILRLRYQIRFCFPNGNLRLQTDFKKRRDPAYFLISGFWSSSLSLQEGEALWAQQPLPSLILQMPQLKDLAVEFCSAPASAACFEPFPFPISFWVQIHCPKPYRAPETCLTELNLQ